MASLLSLLPQPLLEDIYSGQCVPFVGAGFSKNASLPAGLMMPDYRELAKGIASSLPAEVIEDEPLQIISYYEHEHRRPNLVRELNRALHVTLAKPGAAHAAFARLPFDLVVTTNFDFLLEAAYAEVTGRSCKVTIDETQLAIDVRKPAVHLIKMHGDLNHASQIIATEEDYDRYLDRHRLMATFIANLLITKTPLFLGYSLDDYNFRQIFQIVKDRLGSLSRSAYVIQFNPMASTIKRFERRGVTVIQIALGKGDRSGQLAVLFKELLEAWNARIAFDNARSDGPLEELLKPRSSSTRLCLFIVPLERLGYYRSTLFSLLQDYHFDAVLPSDLSRDIGSQTAALGALFERTDLIFADVSSQQAADELRFGLSQRLKDYARIYCVADDPSVISENAIARGASRSNVQTVEMLVRPLGKDGELDIADFLSWLEASDVLLKDRYSFEPRRLFELGEFTASLIASVRHFEAVFREVIEGLPYKPEGFTRKSRVAPSMRQLMELAVQDNLISQSIYAELGRLVNLRNKALHDHKEVKRAEAQLALDLIDSFMTMFASGADPAS